MFKFNSCLVCVKFLLFFILWKWGKKLMKLFKIFLFVCIKLICVLYLKSWWVNFKLNLFIIKIFLSFFLV